MKKNNSKINALIRRKNIVLTLRENRIKNISKDSLDMLENIMENYLKRIIPLLREELIINGRKTLKKEDVAKVLEKIQPKEEFLNWEI